MLIPLHRERLNLAPTILNLDEPPGFAVLIDEPEITWSQDRTDPRIYGPENAEALSRVCLADEWTSPLSRQLWYYR
jgi:hypothetical protein